MAHIAQRAGATMVRTAFLHRLFVGATGVGALFCATSAAGQSSNCYTTGYGQQQHLWCNTTPAPDNQGAQQLQNSESGFANSLVYFIEAQRARVAEKRAQAAQNAGDAQAVATVQGMIAAFQAQPGHERFAELRPVMGDIIRAGRATNLQDAYTLAAAEHPAP